MANTVYKGASAAKAAANIPVLTEEGQYGGKVRKMYDSFVLTADLAAGDTIIVGTPLPEGARLTQCVVTTGALGGACTINVGWQAGPTGLEAAVPTGFFAALPVSSATVATAHGSTYEGAFYQKILQEQVQPVIAENAVSSGGTGQKVQIEIDYVID
jgi:hypothetical protein